MNKFLEVLRVQGAKIVLKVNVKKTLDRKSNPPQELVSEKREFLTFVESLNFQCFKCSRGQINQSRSRSESWSINRVIH